ncbi:hypothetical protein K1W54_32395 [Micromonospora sp. CPCC 205371]|nr:hypothetical protein [Micromonospora sp. CPCC 205371]
MTVTSWRASSGWVSVQPISGWIPAIRLSARAATVTDEKLVSLETTAVLGNFAG